LQSQTPSEPFVGTALEANDGNAVPDARLVYSSAPFTTKTEITGEPWATIYVSSANAHSAGNGQLNIGLSELSPNGSAHEFSHARIGLIGLGPKPVAVRIPLSIAARRIAAGNRLMLAVASSDLAVALPAPGTDPFYVHHDRTAPSFITIPIAPIGRTPPPGQPPTGVSYTDDPIAAICTTLNLPC
jgi:predicted acyl esterase